jgi:hypothetical protein
LFGAFAATAGVETPMTDTKVRVAVKADATIAAAVWVRGMGTHFVGLSAG